MTCRTTDLARTYPIFGRCQHPSGSAALCRFGSAPLAEKRLGLYAGLYAGYGLTDAVEDHDVKLHDAEGNYHGVLASNQVDGVTLVSAGLKIGITLPLGKRPVAPVDTPKVLPDTALPPVVKKDTVAVDSELVRAVALADSLPDKRLLEERTSRL